MSGWIRIERDLWEHPLFAKEPMSEREAWAWMIGRTSWEDTQHRVGGELCDVPRGSFMTTLRELQATFMWRSDTKVRNFLKRLEAEFMIERTTVGSRNAPKTHVTICNYTKYQSPESAENAPKTHRERTKNAVKEQENNKQPFEPVGSGKKSRGSRLPETWRLPRDWGDWAVSEGMDEFTVRREADKFRDYWAGLAGSKATKVNWRLTWQNWVRKAIEDQSGRRGFAQARPGYVNAGAFGMIPEVG